MEREEFFPSELGDKLTSAEQRLIECTAKGIPWEPDLPEWYHHPHPHPANAKVWPNECELRQEVIRCLLTGTAWAKGEKPWPVHARGVQIREARIVGNLDLEGCEFSVRLTIDNSVVLGRVDLMYARTRTIGFDGCHVCGIDATRARIDGSLYLGSGFRSIGPVVLLGAEIYGQLNCSDGKFENEHAEALYCDALKVGASVFLHGKFRARGEVNFRGAQIGGQFSCEDGTFINERKRALDCNTMKVGAEVFLRNNFCATGEVNFSRASVGGNFNCKGGLFRNEFGTALNCNSIDVRGSVDVSEGFRACGAVTFRGAAIAGHFNCAGGSFYNASDIALNFNLVKVGTGLVLNKLKLFRGDLDLSHGETKTFTDDEASWPKPGHIRLDGFRYDRFAESKTDPDTRLAWLKRQPDHHVLTDFRPQPWAQLITVLREMGHEKTATRIAVERGKMIKRVELSPVKKFGYAFLEYTVGYGYRPWRAAFWAILPILIGWFVFYSAATNGYMVKRNDHAVEFAPFVYAFDAFTPAVDLGQRSDWQPSTKKNKPSDAILGSFSAIGELNLLPDEFFKTGGPLIILWLERIFGWILVPLFIAGISGIIKKE